MISSFPFLSNLYQYFAPGESRLIDLIVEIVRRWSVNSIKITSCKQFKKEIGSILRTPVFSTNHQQDPSEFLIKLIDEIKLLYTNKYPDRNNLIEKIFHFTRLKSRKCSSCLLETFYSDEPEFIINLPVHCNLRIDQLICETLTSEYIDMDCSGCKN